MVAVMLTISRLKRFSIAYYNDTADAAKQAAMDSANGGLAEYYSEGDTRIPTWLVVGDKEAVGRSTGLSEGRDGGRGCRHRRRPRLAGLRQRP
jgi:hypothetical protein